MYNVSFSGPSLITGVAISVSPRKGKAVKSPGQNAREDALCPHISVVSIYRSTKREGSWGRSLSLAWLVNV